MPPRRVSTRLMAAAWHPAAHPACAASLPLAFMSLAGASCWCAEHHGPNGGSLLPLMLWLGKSSLWLCLLRRNEGSGGRCCALPPMGLGQKTYCGASAGAARCIALHSALRLPPQRAAFFRVSSCLPWCCAFRSWCSGRICSHQGGWTDFRTVCRMPLLLSCPVWQLVSWECFALLFPLV